MPTSWNKLPKAEKDLIQEALNEQLNEIIDKEEAEVQEIWIKLACILLHDTFGFGEERLLRFISAWKRLYRRNTRCETKSVQNEWLNTEMAKCFPKCGFPEVRLEEMKNM
jgi:hypothetical protein